MDAQVIHKPHVEVRVHMQLRKCTYMPEQLGAARLAFACYTSVIHKPRVGGRLTFAQQHTASICACERINVHVQSSLSMRASTECVHAWQASDLPLLQLPWLL